MLKFAPHTAQLISWIPEGHEEVLFLSPLANMGKGESIRGGIPVCWPWFGSKKGQPTHGIARRNSWIQKGENKFQFRINEAKVILEVTEEQESLTISLITINDSFKHFEFTQALHTYFKVGDISKVSILGHDGIEYYDKVKDENGTQSGTITFDGEFDRIYQTKDSCVLTDPVLNREFSISKEGSDSTVIWNPGAVNSEIMRDMANDSYQSMCCIEAANTHLDPVIIKPMGEHILKQKISVNHLAV